MFKRIVLGLLAMLLMLAAAVAVNTWRHGSRQLQVAPLARRDGALVLQPPAATPTGGCRPSPSCSPWCIAAPAGATR